MTKTITVFDWPGGGTWGIQQFVFAHFLEELGGLSISELTDVNYGRSVGSIGATASLIKDETNPQKPKFSMGEVLDSFYTVAHDIFGKDDIGSLRARGVEHDLHLIHEKEQKRRLFRRNDGNLHLDHSKLSKGMEVCYGDTKMSDLLKSAIVLSQHFKTSTTTAHTNIDPNVFSSENWGLIHNLGGEDRVIDAIMCSTAAPTVFDAYSYDNGKNAYIDGASNYGPSDILLNLRNMYEGPVKFRVVTLGTINLTKQERNLSQYSNSGWLRMGEGHVNGVANEMIKADYARMNILFEGIEHTTFDTDIIDLKRYGMPYQYTSFAGSELDLDFILETSVNSAHAQHDKMLKTIEDICETKIRESMPAITSTRVTEYFYNTMRKTFPRLTPDDVTMYENAILKSKATDINAVDAFSLASIKQMAKGQLHHLTNTTAIPQSRAKAIISSLPLVNKLIATHRTPAPTA